MILNKFSYFTHRQLRIPFVNKIAKSVIKNVKSIFYAIFLITIHLKAD